jgi:hypothetical protein
MIRISLTIEHYCENFIKNKYNKIDKVKETQNYKRDFLMIGQCLTYSLSDTDETTSADFRVVDATKEYAILELLNISSSIQDILLDNEKVLDTNNILLNLDKTLYLYKEQSEQKIDYIAITLNKIVEAELVINL